MGKGLSVIERKFVNAFINNSGNATLAYKQANPSVTEGSARVLGSRLLTRVDIKDLVNKGLEKQTDKSKSMLPSKSDLVNRLQTIDKAAFNEDQYGTCVNSVREQGKLLDLYQEDENKDGYAKLIQTILQVNGPVQINIEKTSKEES